MSYTNLNNPANYQLQSFGQNGVRTISTEQFYIEGEYYRVLVAEADSYVTAVSVLGDDLTDEFVYAGTTIYGLFTEVSVSIGSLTAYIAGPTDIDDVWAYIRAYGEANGATIENEQCAKDTIEPLLDKYYAQASLVMVPSLYKTSIVYSERPLTTDGQLSFTRSNDTATRVNADGLVEKVRTNVLLQSNTFNTTWSLASATITGGQSGYDGTSNAWAFTTSVAGATIQQNITSSGVLNVSIYAKAGTVNGIRLRLDAATDADGFFNLSTGTVHSFTGSAIDANITSLGSGWYRCDLAASISTPVKFSIYTTDGTGSYDNGTIYIQNAQLEASDIATQYIETTTAAVSVGPVANLPRIDYTGGGCGKLLLEPQTTSLCLWSEQLDQWSTAGTGTVTKNTDISPDGYQNADTLNDTDSGGYYRIEQNITTTVGQKYTASVFIKKASAPLTYWAGIQWDTTYKYCIFNNYTGTYALAGGTSDYESVSVQDFGTYWRVSLTTTAGATSERFAIWPALSSDGASIAVGPTGSNVFWGANVTQTSYLQSYVPTLSAAVTRGADNASKAGIASLIGQTEGTLFAEVNLPIGDNSSRAIAIQGGSDRIAITLYNGQVGFVIVTSAGVIYNTITAYTLQATNKIALGYISGNTVLYINGTPILSTSNSFTLGGAMANLYLGQFEYNPGTGQNGQNQAQTLLFKTRLTNAQLAELTTL